MSLGPSGVHISPSAGRQSPDGGDLPLDGSGATTRRGGWDSSPDSEARKALPGLVCRLDWLERRRSACRRMRLFGISRHQTGRSQERGQQPAGFQGGKPGRCARVTTNSGRVLAFSGYSCGIQLSGACPIIPRRCSPISLHIELWDWPPRQQLFQANSCRFWPAPPSQP